MTLPWNGRTILGGLAAAALAATPTAAMMGAPRPAAIPAPPPPAPDPLSSYPLQTLVLNHLGISATECGNDAGMALHNLGLALYSQAMGVRMGAAANYSAAVICTPVAEGGGGVRAIIATASTWPLTAEAYRDQIAARLNHDGVVMGRFAPAPITGAPMPGAPLPLQLGVFGMQTDVEGAARAAQAAMSKMGLSAARFQPFTPGMMVWGRNGEATVVAIIGTSSVGTGPLGSALQTQSVTLLAASASSSTAERYRNGIRDAMTASRPASYVR